MGFYIRQSIPRGSWWSGYKNDSDSIMQCCQKLDDVMNFLPARISALLMVGTAFISGKSYNGKQAWHIWRRDNRKAQF